MDQSDFAARLACEGYGRRLLRSVSEDSDAVTHQHGPDGKHAHPGTVWATWLDPELLNSQLNQVTESLVRASP